jgi:cytochrome b561
VQDAWVRANIAAHKELLRIIDGGGPLVSTDAGVVRLNVHELVTQLATNLGIGSQVAAAQQKLQGSTGAQVRGVAQQKLGVTLPPNLGQITIMRAKNLKTAQDVAGGVKSLAIVFPAIALIMFALAVYLARGRRLRTLRTTGWCFVAIGVLLLLIRRVVGNEIVDSLVKIPSNKPAVHEIWSIATSLLYALAVALIAYGLVMVAAAWLGGHTRPAVFLRRTMAPTLRESPATAYVAVGGVLLLLVAWGPTPALRNILWIAVFAGLLALGVTMLRRETAIEFPALASAGGSGPATATIAPGRLDELERLVALHDRGDLTDQEFAAEKTVLATNSKS